MTRIIGVSDLATIGRTIGATALMDDLIGRLRDTLATFNPEQIDTRDRTGFSYRTPGLGLIEWMPAMDVGRVVSIKTVGYHPANPRERHSPSVLATTSVYDTSDGRLLFMCEATALTALRTGAASALASDVLARPGSSVLGLVGCGAQAVAQAHAMSRVRPIERILAFDIDPSVARSLADRLAPLGVTCDVEVVGDDELGCLMASVDILSTATTVEPGAGPVVPESEHRPWLHVNAVGADFPGKTELPLAYLADALVCPDVPAQCLLEGEAQQLAAAELGPDLATLVRNEPEYRRHRDLLTVFDSTGWAVEDLVAAELVYDHSVRLGLGTEIDLHPTTSDPYNPYQAMAS